MKYFNRNKTLLTVLPVCLTILATAQSLQAQQVQSDYQIQSDFKSRYNTINTSLDNAENVIDVDTLISQIRLTEMEYGEHEDLLDKALFPDTYEERIESLKRRAVSVQSRLATIENQAQRMKELAEYLSYYSARINRLNNRVDSTQLAMRQSAQNEQQFAEQLNRYRQSLEQRDELILTIIDSVMITYRDMDIETLANLENVSNRARINSEGNPLTLVQTIVDENVEFMNSNPNLSTSDYLRMNIVQKEFAVMWNRIGTKLTETYGDNPQQVNFDIQNRINSWADRVQGDLWSSIQASFTETGIDLPEFGDSQTFAAALNNYLDGGVDAGSDNGARRSFREYQIFSVFWNNQVKGSWGEFLTRGEVLTGRQMATLDQKITRWAGIAEPESNTFLYLFGASVLAVVVLGVMLFREKSVDPQKGGKT